MGGLHYGGISCSAVGSIRRKVREGQLGIGSDLDPLASRIRTTHIEKRSNARVDIRAEKAYDETDYGRFSQAGHARR